MKLAAAVLAAACLTSQPTFSAAQDAPLPRRQGTLRPLITGTAAGLGLAIAMVNQQGDAWLIDDEAALPLSLAMGIATAFVVRGQSSDLDHDTVRRPRLRVAAGMGDGMTWDLSLGYRTPVRERLELEGMVLVINDTWEQIETETRCSEFFGCFTGQFLTDYRYGQSIGLIGRASYVLLPHASVRPALAIGGGPILLHLDAQDAPAMRRTGALLDGALTFERGGRSRWIAEAGWRVVAGGAGSHRYAGGWSVRSGWALGY